jgi:hypothetical protein
MRAPKLAFRHAIVLSLLIGWPSVAAAQNDDARTDHEKIVGGVGLGYLGYRNVPAALPHPTEAVLVSPNGNAVVGIEDDNVTVPLFGVRYWFAKPVAMELGVGFAVAGGDETIESPNADPARSITAERTVPDTLAFAARLSVPLSLYDVSHFNFLLIPEIDFGYSRMSFEAFDVSTSGSPLDLSLSGLVFGAGARLGAAVSFGFVDVPQLWLQAAWGLHFESQRRSGEIGDASTTRTQQSFGTSGYREPWDIFLGGFSFLYYL